MEHDPSSLAVGSADAPVLAPARPSALFVAADLPWPPDGGGRIATLRMLEGFASRFEVDLIALADVDGTADVRELERICRSVTVIPHPFTFGRHRSRQLAMAARSLFSIEPYRIRKFRSRRLQRAVVARMLTGRYDVVHFDQLGVAPYVRGDGPRTAAAHNVESELYRLGSRAAQGPLRRTWAALEGWKLSRAEPRLLRAFDRVFVLSTEDAGLMERLGVTRVTVVPMPAPQVDPVHADPPRSPTLITLGSMSWFGVEDGLLWFHRHVFPLIRRRVPDIRWLVAGPNAGPAIRAMAADPSVELLGYVPDIRTALRDARVGIVPLQVAGGVRMKLLDLMAWGIPSVTTSVGATGLDFAEGEGAFRQDEPATFADSVVMLLSDDSAWRRTVEGGVRYIGLRHSRAAFDAALERGIALAIQRHVRLPPISEEATRTVRIGDLQIHDVTPVEADDLIMSWLTSRDGAGRTVCTPNADHVVKAHRDPAFRAAIERADLRVPDGMWVVYASRLAGRPLRGTVTGRLLVPRLAAGARDLGMTIGLIGAGPGVARAAARRLERELPGLMVRQAISPPMGLVIGSDEDAAIVDAVRRSPPDLLFLALGAPKQELWMDAHRDDLPGTVMIGVGAAFDIVAGRFREAPAWMTGLGLEWLFRLAQEPRRLARRYLVDDPWILWWAIRARMGRS